MNMETEIKFILQSLKNAGFEGRIVGGYVRDLLLKKNSSDIDVATTATPEKTMEIFENLGCKVIPTGMKHGTVTVIKNSVSFEITTLRKDLRTDGRHAEVGFTDSWEEDAARRDFTFNALYLDLDGKIYDFFGGANDLLNRTIKFIGDPEERIKEDFLRILRYFRFAAQLGLEISDNSTLFTFQKYSKNLLQLSRERIRHEFEKTLFFPTATPLLFLMDKYEILDKIIDLNRGNFKKFHEIYLRNPRIILEFMCLTPSLPAKVFLIANSDTLPTNLCLSKAEKSILKFLKTPLEFPEISEENLTRNIIFYDDDLIFEKLAVEILKKVTSKSSQFQDIEAMNLLKTLQAYKITYQKGRYTKTFPVKSADVIPFAKAPHEISKMLLLIKNFWALNFGTPSKSSCLEFLRENLTQI